MAESNLTKLKSIFGFGDDLGIDAFDPERKNGSRLQNRNSLYGFGDDLGIDGYDPEGGPITKLVKKQQEQSS